MQESVRDEMLLASLLKDLLPNCTQHEQEFADVGLALRLLIDGWIKRGGFVRGKPRHSARQIREWLAPNREICSLEPKLAGKTRLQKDDARNILELILHKWQYDPHTETYKTYQDRDIFNLVENILDEIFSDNFSSIFLSERVQNRQGAPISILAAGAETQNGKDRDLEIPEGAETSRAITKKLFASSDALITISREKSIIGPNPEIAIALFRSLLRDLYLIDKDDSRKRTLVWIMDIGARDRIGSSNLAFFNVETMAGFFRSVAIVNSDDVNFWRWLTENVIIIVGSLRRSEINYCYEKSNLSLPDGDFDEPRFMGDRLFLGVAPTRWYRDVSTVKDIDEDEDFWREPITAHLSIDGWENNCPVELDPGKEFRFFFHVQPRHLEFANPVTDEPYCIELGPPGRRWSYGFWLASKAAFGRLNQKHSPDTSSEETLDILALLRQQSFAVMTLSDFLELTNNLISINVGERS